MSLEIIELMKSHADSTTDEFSHVSLFGNGTDGTSGGKYYIDHLNFDSFMIEYCKLATSEDFKSGIAEIALTNIPCVFDFDLSSPVQEPLYSSSDTIDIIHIIQDVLKETLIDVPERSLVGTLHEKSGYMDTEKKKYKNGFHIHFPMVFVNKAVYRNYIIPRLRIRLNKYTFFVGKDVNTIVDDAPCKTPWLMYGSSKGIDKDPYLLSAVYEYHSAESDLELLRRCQVKNIKKVNVFFEESLEFYYPLIFSTATMGRDVYCVKDAFVFTPVRVKTKASNHHGTHGTHGTPHGDMVRDLVGMLHPRRSENYNDWIQVGLVLHSITKGSIDGLVQFKSFSRQCADKYNEDECTNFWNKLDADNGQYSLGTLIYFAKQDDPDKYTEWCRLKDRVNFMNISPDNSQNDFAKILHHRFGSEFVYVSFKTGAWYRFNHHRWCLCEDGYALRKKITNYFTPIVNSSMAELSQTNSVENQAKIGVLKKLKKEFGMAKYKDAIMRECKEEFYNDTFLKMIDSNPRLVGFKNGVYDLDKGIFRNGCPDDYISMSTGIDYKEFASGGIEQDLIENYLEQTFPDPEVRKYWLDVYSESFCGENTYKKFFLWTGSGNNGKSVLTSILEKMYGAYSIDLPTSLVTQKRASSNSASPEMARSEGSRVAWLKEPSADEKINVGIIKELTGNDTIYTRGLYKEGHEIKCMFDLTMVCNTPPILENDIAVWNRARIIPFESEFVDKVDGDYVSQLAAKKFVKNPLIDRRLGEYAQIMAWYLLQWKRNKPSDFILEEPKKVTDSTATYRSRHNPFKQFIDEGCLVKSQQGVSVDDVYDAFKEFYEAEYSNKFPPSKITFKDEMNKLLGKCTRPSSGILEWKGYALSQS